MIALPSRLLGIRTATRCCDFCLRQRQADIELFQAMCVRLASTWTHDGTHLLRTVHVHNTQVRRCPPPQRSREFTADFYRTVSSHDMEKFLDTHMRAVDVSVPCWGKPLTLRMRVFDNHPEDVEQRRLTVVCLPGRGTKETDAGFIPYLCAKGVRVIVPDRVDRDKIVLRAHQRPAVDYSLHGKHLRLEAVLAAKNIERVDLLISGQSAFWTLLKAGASWENIHSLAVVDPGESLPNKYLHQFIRYKRLLSYVTNTVVRRLIRPLLEILFFTLGDSTETSSSIKQKVLDFYLMTLAYSWENPRRAAANIREKRLPLLLFLMEGHRLARLDKTVLVSKVLGIPKKNLLWVSKVEAEAGNEEPFHVPETSWFARTIVFERGIDPGSRSRVITELLEELLVRVRDVDFPDLDDNEAGDTENGEADETDQTTTDGADKIASGSGNEKAETANGTGSNGDGRTTGGSTDEHSENLTIQKNKIVEKSVTQIGDDINNTLNEREKTENKNGNEDKGKTIIDETGAKDKNKGENSKKKETIYDI